MDSKKFELRDYQEAIAQQGAAIVRELGMVYLAMEMQTGKTHTSFRLAELLGAERVLFLTTKKAIGAIQAQAAAFGISSRITIINDGQLHKLNGADYDLVIHDEHHRFGAFPKPGVATKMFKEKFGHLPMVFLSGTPSPESYSQLYFQFWVSERSPFKEDNFYKWAKAGFVKVTQQRLPQGVVNNYKDGQWDCINEVIAPYMLYRSYAENKVIGQAGFDMVIEEEMCKVPMPIATKKMMDLIMTDGVIQGNTGIVSAANAAIQLSKVHQFMGGTIILDPEEGEEKGLSVIFDRSKAEYIKRNWPTEKLVIFYCFKAEYQVIYETLGDRITTDVDEFKRDPSKSIVLQVVSGREGINLAEAEAIVFYNIAFSATSYFQARARMTTKDRKVSKVYWLMFEGGLEKKIYQAVTRKKTYTTTHFKRDYSLKPKRAVA